MKRRTFAAAAVTAPLLSACLYDDIFAFEWEEEIRLHDQSVIVAHVKHTFARVTQGILPYGGMIVPRDCTLSFDAGVPAGKVGQLFRNFRPVFLDRDDGVWYAVLEGAYFTKYKETTGQYWGEYEAPGGHRTIALLDGKWQPISLKRLPAKFKIINMLLLVGTADEWAKFDGTRLTLNQKAGWLLKHPPTPDNYFLSRPPEVDPASSDPMKSPIRGASK